MLFHSVSRAGGRVLCHAILMRLRRADPEMLARAWQQVVDRHGVFRTAFAWKGVAKPRQVVGRKASIPIAREDWRRMKRLK